MPWTGQMSASKLLKMPKFVQILPIKLKIAVYFSGASNQG